MISRPRNTRIRSFDSAITIAPSAETIMRAWSSGPSEPSRSSHPWPTNAVTMTAHDTRIVTNALKPSWTTDASMVTCGP